jgi:PilZ domain
MTTNIELPGHFLSRSGFLKADRRTKRRNQTFKFGVITFGSDRRLCVVKNISPTGALIEVDNAIEISDEFTLAIESEPSPRACRVAWKKAKQIAVNFDGARREVRPDRQEGAQNGRKDRRQAPRRNLNTVGWIRLDGSFAMRECKIVDVSTAGVQLAISFAGKILETFTLFSSKGAQGHRVRVVWRRANQIGAKFI